jgi:hypothetical protein
MSSNVTKRTLSAGLGVGALALLAPRASADTPFSSFAFRATGAPTARTLPDRLGELTNVKDFGATGDGSTDDTNAIQAAVNKLGTIYFPPGQYRLTRPVILQGDQQYNLVGAGGTYVYGAFDGYLFDCPVWNGDIPFHYRISGFKMRNDGNTPNSGCIRIRGGMVVTIEQCELWAWRCVTLPGGATGRVSNCFFRNSQDLATSSAGITEKASIGLAWDIGSLACEHCDFNGFYTGIQVGSNLAAIRDCRVEMCYRGIIVGPTTEEPNPNDDGLMTSIVIENIEMEANTYHLILRSVDGAKLSNVSIQGDQFAVPANPPGDPNVNINTPGQIGIWFRLVNQLVMECCGVGGNFQQGCIVFEKRAFPDWIPLRNSVLMVVSAVLDNSSVPGRYPDAAAWVGLGNIERSTCTFIQCNQPTS